MKKFLPLLILPLLCSSCSLFSSKEKEAKPEYSEARTRMESEAQIRLAEARTALSAGDCARAKAVIEKMRKDCYLALAARKEGILLMDSVNIRQSKDELQQADSLLRFNATPEARERFDEACRKVQFHERKLQYDRK